MKVLGLVLLALATASAAPATTRSPGEPDDCSKECLNGVIQYGQELSILKHPDLSNYFNKLDEVCEVISTARKCLERCGATSNPFALESLNLVCQPKTQEKIESLKQCLHYIDSNINEVCSKECTKEHIIDETDVKMTNPLIQKANGDCANFKCMARCNVEVVASQCGKDLGKEFQGLLQEVVDAQRKDLESLQLLEAMAKTSPPECNYLYDNTVLFGGKKEQSSEEAPVDPKEDAKALLAQAQLQLLVKQIELTDKQDHLIDRENAKIDMEMAYMAHKTEMKEMKFHAQHSLPTFVPMEKEPKMPIAMEPISHPEQQQEQQPEQEGPAHPEEAHPHPEQMQSEPHPEEPHHEEPAHPEHPPMEAQQPEMPLMEAAHPPMPMEQQPIPSMESHPPMDFPHPEAMPMEMPRKHHKMPKFGPIMINGVPMEFIPLGEIPPPQMEMPMHIPMEVAAMPRFL